LSGNINAFVIKINQIEVPRNVHEALQDLNWKGAMLEEMKIE